MAPDCLILVMGAVVESAIVVVLWCWGEVVKAVHLVLRVRSKDFCSFVKGCLRRTSGRGLRIDCCVTDRSKIYY